MDAASGSRAISSWSGLLDDDMPACVSQHHYVSVYNYTATQSAKVMQ